MAEKNPLKPTIQAFDGGEKKRSVDLFTALTDKLKAELSALRPDIAKFVSDFKSGQI